MENNFNNLLVIYVYVLEYYEYCYVREICLKNN